MKKHDQRVEGKAERAPLPLSGELFPVFHGRAVITAPGEASKESTTRPLARSPLPGRSAAAQPGEADATAPTTAPGEASKEPAARPLARRSVPEGRSFKKEETPSFESLLGPKAWARLAPAIRVRFAKTQSYRVVHHRGTMTTVRASRAGFLLAQFCRLFGTPLAPFQGQAVPVVVRISPLADGEGSLWERSYHFSGRKPIVVSSTKLFEAGGKLVECIRGGFGMELQLEEHLGALHFKSRRYFWQAGRLRVPLPLFLTPGEALITHSEAGEGRFRFTLSFIHPLLGETFFQEGLFREVDLD